MSDLQALREAVERRKNYFAQFVTAEMQSQFEADTAALADFAARVLSGMPELGELPGGKWQYVTDDACFVLSDGRVIVDFDASDLSEEEEDAVAALLVWARGVGEIEA